MFQGPHHDEVVRSLLTLECLTYEPTGGVVAAPTTSLAETIGGTRNWDYRYCWIRDATLTLQALLLGGYREEAARFRQWVLRAVAGDPERLQIMYGVSGERRLTELTLDWLPGWEGSRPVRIGNAAHAQLQLDVYGELADVMWQAARAGSALEGDAWALQLLLTESLATKWREPDQGIWEVRGPRRHFVHSKVLAWVAFDRAIAMVEHSTDDAIDGPVDTWRAIRNEIHDAGVRARLQREARYVRAVVRRRSTRCVGADDPARRVPARRRSRASRRRSTRSTRELTVDGLVHAVRPAPTSVDGIGEPEGVFLACSFWMVSALASIGRRDEAARALRTAADARQRRRPVLRGVRPREPAHARQLPAGVHASRVGRRRAGSDPARDPRHAAGTGPTATGDAGSLREIGRRWRPLACPPWLS